MKLKNKTVLITGGSSGIGLEMSRQMVAEGAKVIICGRSEHKLNKAKELVSSLITIQADITNSDDRIRLYSEIENKYSDINLVVNNAAIANRFIFDKTENLENYINSEIETNFTAPIIIAKLFLDLLIKNHGQIVNVTSGLAYVPLRIEPIYCATKAALHSMTQSLRYMLEPKGLTVTEIFYPEVDTPFQEGHATPNAISATLAASIAIKGLKKERKEIRVKKANLIYVLSRIMPKGALNMLNGFITKEVEETLSLK